ncbi:MAG TPA: hypothetical protein PLT91_05425 [Clostridia bacterium]|jgi:hypothetical protein|nr:MAG: hypothetical protein BWX97_00564 [Firmicutes bacterium ADurb.Bin146]HOD93439.1 hypothetical protein [Clostridia bacterium]HQM39661.1 hypothetical protein [Clostridia bacterium]
MRKFVFVISYALKRMTRDAIKSLILILVAASFTILISEISFSLEKQYTRMNEAYETIDVEGFLTMKDGTEAKVYSKYIKMFSETIGEYSSYIKDLCLKRSVYYLPSENYTPPDGEALPNLIGISRTKADVSLLPVNKAEITYYENYDESAFLSDSDICLVSAKLAEGKSTGTPRIDKDGYITLYAYIELVSREMVKVPIKLKVIGTYTNGDKDIYCPWPVIVETLKIGFTGDLYSEGLKFTITDNLKIDEFKEKASKIFVPTGYMGNDKDTTINMLLL